VGAALVLLMAGGVYSLSKIRRDTALVRDADEVQLSLSQVLTALVDLETGQRGYMASGDRRFLEPYTRTTSTLRGTFDHLAATVRDDPAQQGDLRQLDRLATSKLDETRATLEAYEAGTRGPELAARMMAGKRTMDRIRLAVAEMDGRERRLRFDRQDALAERWRETVLLLAGAGVGLLSAMLVASVQRRNAQARQRLAEERARSTRFAEQFIGILGHDLRNPLNAIEMSARLLKRKGNGETPQLDRILSSSRRMSRMVAQLLDLTRSRLAGGIAVEKRATDLSCVVSETVDELRVQRPGGIRWEPPGELQGTWDPDRMAQVASNLISNALEHGDPASPVEVRLAREDRRAVLAVHSEGAPIPSDLMPVIFDPYARVTARNPKSKGLGLGLFITQQIIQAHGGSIEVSSTENDGTTFTVWLPI
jgi:signal transduction histidine kinase